MRTILLFLALLLAGCQEYGHRSFHAYFWGKIPSADQYHLYIDGADKGLLPYMTDALAGNPDSMRLQALRLQLQCGRYKLLLKDNRNNIVSKGELLVKAYGGSTNVSYTGDGKCGLKVVF